MPDGRMSVMYSWISILIRSKILLIRIVEIMEMQIPITLFLLNFSKTKYEINIAKIADLDVVKIIIAINVDTIKKLINLRKIFLWLLNKNPRQRGNIIHNQAPA